MSSISTEKASFRTLLRISLPLMISYLSLFTMLFVDRAFLAKLSTEALNAAVRAGTLAWAINLGWVTLAAMAEVFVAQYNGAKNYNRLGTPVWQMIWVSIFSLAAFVPLGIWGGSWIYQSSPLAAEYFRWIIFTGPSYVILSAISAFYIGQGKTILITVLAVAGNTLNIILDPLLIFGHKGIVPAMGVKGAAIATGFGVIFQVIVLFFTFLHRRNRESKGTHNWQLVPSEMAKCLKVGISPALFMTFELFGWALFYHMMGLISDHHIFVSGVCQSIFMLFIFFGYGLEKGVAAMAGNYIGAGRHDLVYSLMRKGLLLITLFIAILSVFMVIKPHLLVNWFINEGQSVAAIAPGLALVFIYTIFEKIRWLFNGILTAAGDTFFLMASGTLTIWIGMVLPTYLFIVLPKAHVTYAFVIWAVYSMAAALIFIIRFIQGKWKTLDIIHQNDTPLST